MIPFLICLSAILLDRYAGEPRRWHPLAAFGRWAELVESYFYGEDELPAHQRRRRGVVALAVAVLPLVLFAGVLSWLGPVGVLFDVLILYIALGGSALAQQARQVISHLRQFDVEAARRQVGRIVNRDTLDMDEQSITKVTVEAVLGKGNGVVFAMLFWYVVLGAPGVVMVRLVNILDSMWGYHNNRYRHFGWAAARFDDVLNWVPARLTALTYTLLGNRERAWRCWRRQGRSWPSPNTGTLMAAGAGAMSVSLGGEVISHGEVLKRPVLGEGPSPKPTDIERAITIIEQGQWWWLGVILVLGVL